MFLRRVIQEPVEGALPGESLSTRRAGNWGDSHQAGGPGSQNTVPQKPEEESSFIIWFEESKHLGCAGNDLFTGALTPWLQLVHRDRP